MSNTSLQYLLLFIILILLQIIVFNNLVLFNVAVCFIFIYIIIRLPLSLSTNWLLTISFLAGLIVDICADTPGLNSLSSVVLAILKRTVTFLYISKDDKTKGEVPCLATMGWGAYSKYLVTMSGIFCLLDFVIEFMSFANPLQILIMVVTSTLFTFLVLLSTDCILDSYNAKRL